MDSISSNKKILIDSLVKKLNDASDAYYNGKEELMSNYEWDKLFDQLSDLEKQTGYVLSNSPTQTVGTVQNNDGDKVAHEYPALSLAKTKDINDMIDWAGERDVWLSWKLDGLTLVATYDNGNLSSLVTRGNGIIGTNITSLASAIQGIPLSIHLKTHLVIRGEAIITYSDFENFCLSSDNDYANPRNLASGSLSLKDINEVKKRNIQWIPFTLVHTDELIVSWGERMELLKNLGFHPVEAEKLHPKEIEDAITRWSKRVASNQLDYPVDGLVMVFDDTEYARRGGATGHHEKRAGLAYKWQDTSKTTRLEKVEWSCAASTITPVAIFDPVELEGTTVKRATLHNISECRRLGIGGRGTEITVIKANKIIPKIIAAKSVGEFSIPNECPVCHHETKIEISSSGAETLHCTNRDCAAKHLKKYERFVSKYGMDINGLSLQTLNKFMNQGYIKNFSDIYLLKQYEDQIKRLDGFGEKSVDNLFQAIENSRQVKAENLLFALGIPMIGVDAARKIIQAIGFEQFLYFSKNKIDFSSIDGIGEKMSASIIEWYENNSDDLNLLLQQLTVQDNQVNTSSQKMCNQLTFVITGSLNHYKNRDALKSYILSQNGHVTGSVSRKTDYLINNDINSKSGKNKKAKELNIPIITEDDFIRQFTNEG